MSRKIRPHSHYAQEAAILLGQMIRRARIERSMTAEELAERAGISRGLLRRIENGDLSCTLGAVFEVASIAGVRLFEADETAMRNTLGANTAVMALIPKAVRIPRVIPDDNF